MSDQDKIQRTVLPIPDQPRSGLILYDAKDPENKYPPITQLRPPKGAPNVLIVLIDDAGFGSSSAFGGRSCVIGGYLFSGSFASYSIKPVRGGSGMGRTVRGILS